MSIVGQTAHIDSGVTLALAHYLAFGLDPGSFGMALLKGDRDTAYATAHETLKPGSHGVEDVVATMFEVVESAIPTFARGEDITRWMKHKGLSKAPDSIKTMTKLAIANDVIWNHVVRHHPEVIRSTKTEAA